MGDETQQHLATLARMHKSVTVHMSAPADDIWNLVADVGNTGRFSPETFKAEWLDGATGPVLGARFRGHVKRNEIGPVYWTTSCSHVRNAARMVASCPVGHRYSFASGVGSTTVATRCYAPPDSWRVCLMYEVGEGSLEPPMAQVPNLKRTHSDKDSK